MSPDTHQTTTKIEARPQIDGKGEAWEAVYYPNPVPLSSATLLSCALLFDKLYTPGVSIPQIRVDRAAKKAIREEFLRQDNSRASENLGLWALEQPSLASFVSLPNQDLIGMDIREQTHQHAIELFQDSYSPGKPLNVVSIVAGQIFFFPGAPQHGMALTWPLYQANAAAFAAANNLPLVSDDPAMIPPFPRHPDAKSLAIQIATEAVSLVLPNFRSVEPGLIAEFRHETNDLAKEFRLEMLKLTAELSSGIAAGATEDDLKHACKLIVDARVAPAFEQLKRELTAPLKPWNKIAVEVTEFGLYAAASSIAPNLTVAWSVLRAIKLAQSYFDIYSDRDGKRKSGLAYLLRAQKSFGANSGMAEWDRRDWRCSGWVYIPDPDGKPRNAMAREVLKLESMRSAEIKYVIAVEMDRSERHIVAGAGDDSKS